MKMVHVGKKTEHLINCNSHDLFNSIKFGVIVQNNELHKILIIL